MSLEAMNYVVRNSPYRGMKLFVHLMVADVVNDMHENEFFMSNEELALKTRSSRETVNRSMNELTDDGFLVKIGRKGKIVKYRFIFKETPDVYVPRSQRESVTTDHSKCDEKSQSGVTTDHTELKKNESGTQTPKQLEESALVGAVWDAYIGALERFKPGTRKPVFTPARKQTILRRHKEGYSKDDLILAVTGWEHSDWHKGDNPSGAIYNKFDRILAADKIETSIGLHERTPQVNSRRTISDKWGTSQTEMSSDTLEVDEGDWDD